MGKPKKTKIRIWIALALIIILQSIMFADIAAAASTVPQKMMYEGRLLDSTGANPKTTSHTFRFSLWSQSAVDAGDVSIGLINVLAPNYGGWQESHDVVPNSDGYFSVELGSLVTLPQIDSTTHLYLQVEVKETGQADTDYEILDNAPSDASYDRSAIGSVPYALNADRLDNADVGTSVGDVVILEIGGVWPVSTIPGGTNEDAFVLDSDDSSLTSIDLQFGSALGKILSWDIVNGYFNFNDDVNIEGDLTLTGTINGVDISTLDTSVNDHLDGGASKHDASEIDVEAVDGHYYTAGDLEAVIDDIDEQLYNTVVGGGGVGEIVISTIYDGVSYIADGSDNIGRLYVENDDTVGRNYYAWTSTRNSLQDYDVIIQVPVPSNFSTWDGVLPWTFNYKSTNANTTENQADIYVWDTDNNPVTLTGTYLDLASLTWAQTQIGYSGTPTFTPGETFIILIKLHAKSSETIQLGEVILNYSE